MNNLKGYCIDHPQLDSITSEWFIFTHKYKLYQVSISIDSFHNNFEYDIRVFSYNKYLASDKIELDNMYKTLNTHGIENTSVYTKESLKRVFSVLNQVVVRDESQKNVTLGPYLKKMLKEEQPIFNISKNIGDIYYELILDRVY